MTNQDLKTKSHGKEIIFNGHLCEGSELVDEERNTFCLWARCGKLDVPGGKAYEGDIKEVTCADCQDIWNKENGQFGVGI